MSEKKVKQNGKVLVAVSRGFGAGWSTWNNVSPFEPKVIQMIKDGKQEEITEEWCSKELGIDDVYCSGAEGLYIESIDEGEPFSIDEYDGNESISIGSRLPYTA